MPGLITGGYLIRCAVCPTERHLDDESLTRAVTMARSLGWVIPHDQELLVSNASTLCPPCERVRRRSAS